jgi:hypothetical protein
MNKNSSLKVLAGILLAAASSNAMAQSALRQLGRDAGIDAAPLAAQMQAVRAIDAAPAVSAETMSKIEAAFANLQAKGFPGVQWQRLPVGVHYARVPVQRSFCPGCVSYDALIPYGVVAPRAPVGDPNKASYFILARSGDSIKPESAYSTSIVMPGRDLFARCSDVDALALRAWSLPEAVARTQSCLDKTFNQHPLARRIYFVTAAAASFGVPVCGNPAPGAMTCDAIVEVQGVQITVSGRVPADDTAVSDLGYSLRQRNGMLYGYHAAIDDQAGVMP